MICQAGYENFLAREVEDAGGRVVERGPGWARAELAAASVTVKAPEGNGMHGAADVQAGPELAFAHLILREPVEIVAESVNALAQRVGEFFLQSLQGERVEAVWPCLWAGPHEVVGLGRRVGAVEAAFGELLKAKLSRVARLAVRGGSLPRSIFNRRHPGTGRALWARGLFVFFTDFRRAFVAREAWAGGQRRMADDALAPSRSFLKIEEAYGVLGCEPQAGEVVVDLGAAPGGWSYSAAKRGARVIAVDNGPLKGGALGHALIEHRREDAFGFRVGVVDRGEGPLPTLAGVGRADWLFCDLVEEPHHVLRGIVGPWLESGWCRRFVVNLKFGRVDPVALLREVRAADSLFSRCATDVRVRHLYHDREELTVVGEVR